MPKRRDGRPMCIRTRCRSARHDGLMVCAKHYADQLWATRVKDRDGFCLMKDATVPGGSCVGAYQADHLISRRYGATRWNVDIGATLCLGHHKHLTEHPLEHQLFAEERLGQDRYIELRRLALYGDAERPEDAIERLKATADPGPPEHYARRW